MDKMPKKKMGNKKKETSVVKIGNKWYNYIKI